MRVACGFIDPIIDAPCVRPAVTFVNMTTEARVPCCAVCLERIGLPFSGDI